MLFRRPAVAALALVVLGPLAPVASAAPSPDHRLNVKQLPRPERPRDAKDRAHEPHTLLVEFKRGASAAAKDKVLKSRGARTTGAVAGTGFLKVHTTGAAVDVLRTLRRDPAVQSVSLDYRRTMTATPNDPGYTYGDQNYLNTVRMPQAWDRTKGSTAQVIAVVDTGVNGAHQDLTGRVLGGYNAITNALTAANSNSDDNGHGSMVAGIAAANTNNGVGVAGVSWVGRILPVKVLDSQGEGYDSDVAEGVTWAANHGAKVINLSLGGTTDDPALHSAITYATGKGAVVVVAAGNHSDDTPQYPAAYPEVLAVGATDDAGNLTDFSSWGDWVDVAAPGFGIVSTGLGQDYFIGDGTSFAAPIASGVAALMRTLYPTQTPAQVVARIRATARDAGPRGLDPYYGGGVLDAYQAVGGTWGAEFPQRALGANEPNDVPARAAAVTTSITGSMAMEGDVDWYRYESTEQKSVAFTVTPPAYDGNRAQNFDPVLAVYDTDLRLVGEVDAGVPGEQETLSATLDTGTYYVTVRNFNGAADTRSYTLGIGATNAPMFKPAQSTAVGSWPETVAVGDVTGDGRNDVLLATSSYFDEQNDDKLFVFAQNADGSLQTPTKYATQLQSAEMWGAGLALLDADGDGRRDVALATNAGLQIFRQTDGGALESSGVLPASAGGRHLVAGDMDADGDTDLVMSGAPGIVLFTHEADGTFTPTTVTADGTGEVELGDVDSDGRADVVGFSGQSVNVFHHGLAGWSRTDHATGSTWSTNGVEVADINGDGRADITATVGGNSPNSFVGVFLQNAAGGLNDAVLHPVMDIPEPIESADMDGDSRTDVVTAHGGWNTLSVLLQKSDGTLSTPNESSIPYASHYNVQALALGDINGDGRRDAVIADYNSGLVVLRNNAGPTPAGEQVWVRDVAPADFATGASQSVAPTVTFQRALDPASVTSSTVRLLHGRTGAAVAATLVYDEATKTVTLTPAAPLQDNTAYRIVVDGVKDQSAATQTERFTTTFRTVDVAPAPVTNVKATGAYRAVTLSWTNPGITDLDQVIVRMGPGGTVPSSPTAGTAVYAGAGTSATASGLAGGTNYNFRIWVRDRSGKYSSTAPTITMIGTTQTIGSSTTLLTYGGAVTVTGKLSRPDTGAAIAGATVQLYARRKGTTSLALLATATSSSTGTLSFTHKPSYSTDYEWIYRGSPTYIGTASSLRSVGVRTAVSATLSKTSFALGGSVALYGTVAPNHAGQTVYLQRLVSGSWKNVTSRALSSTSSYSFTIKPSSRGTYYYRVYKPADSDHVANASSTRSFKVT